MVQSNAKTAAAYLAGLPPERRRIVAAVRDVILRNIDPGFRECMQHGMISFAIPLERFADTYNGQPLGLVAIAAQKGYCSVYLMNVYGDPKTERWFRAEWQKTGKKLDMGKSCVRFKSLDDIPLDLIGRAVARTTADAFIRHYQAVRKAYAGKKKQIRR